MIAETPVLTLESGLQFDNSFARLPPIFYSRLSATPLPAPYLVARSDSAARLLGIEPGRLSEPEWIEALSGNRPLVGSDPLAAVYSGHQFGVYVPQLGDGRALLLGEVMGAHGDRWEVQLKGAGRTPYSRMGDGRAVLRSSIREFLASEAMHGLGIPTTRALAVTGSDTPVFRETAETAAVVTRLAPSFIRFGTFEYFHWTRQHEALAQLADYVIDRHYPECRDSASPVLALLETVARRTARLVAQWQGVGFCHGVLNSDNMSILGLTIDYGPFGFLDGYDGGHVCNHSDEQGRYAYDMQPQIAHWNLYALGQALLPLTKDIEPTKVAIDTFATEYGIAIEGVFRAKLGLSTARADDVALLTQLLELLQAGHTDWTIFWRRLSTFATTDVTADATNLRDLFVDREAFDAWARIYRQRLIDEGSLDRERALRMNAANPKYVLRNHLAEVAIRRARGDEGARDFNEIARLTTILSRPYEEQPEHEIYA
ncbi:MAG: protein adenylyltransferase SelO, partial [Burkholderiaceae bacterium]